MARAKFTKVYLVIDGTHIFSKSNYKFIDMFREKSDAERVCSQKKAAAYSESKMYNAAGQPVPQYKVHAFYLLHESLF